MRQRTSRSSKLFNHGYGLISQECYAVFQEKSIDYVKKMAIHIDGHTVLKFCPEVSSREKGVKQTITILLSKFLNHK